MARTKERDARREARWRGEVERQRGSGLSVRDYCRRRGLVESAFYFWRREIERRDGETSGAAPAFVPIIVDAAAARDNAIEVTLRSGHVVRVRAGFDAETLRQLLALLEAPPC